MTPRGSEIFLREPAPARAVRWLVRRVVDALILGALLGLVPLARAQSDAGTEAAPDARDPFRALVDSDPFAGDEDPVGASDDTADPLAARDTADLRTAVLPGEDETIAERLPITRGEVLSAAAGVRESEHRTRVTLVAGLALVRSELRFESRARHAAEIVYRIAVPEGATPFALEVCAAPTTCRAGRLETEAAGRLTAYDAALVASGPMTAPPPPIATLERADATHLLVRAAPIPASGVGGDGQVTLGQLVVRVGWAVPVPVRGGVARLTLPPRGADVRAAIERLSLVADDLVVPEIDGVEVGPDEEIERRAAQEATLVARVPRTWTSRLEAWAAPCGREQCVWARASSDRPVVERQDVVLAIDASPSTTAGARGLLPEAARSVLASLPSGSRVRVVAFAGRAEDVVGAWTEATEIQESALRRATELELGASTRFEALWSAIEPGLSPNATVIWIGDGGLTSSDEASGAIERAAQRGARLRFVSMASRQSTPALSAIAQRFGTRVEHAHREGLLAARDRREALDERIAALLSRDPLREQRVRGVGGERTLVVAAGGAEVFSARGSGRLALTTDAGPVSITAATGELALAIAAIGQSAVRLVAADAPAAALACGDGESVLHGSGVISRITPLPNRLAIVERRACRAPSSTASASASSRRSALSPASLLRTLRQRVLPRARDCFRSDRRGRADYSTEVQLILTLADREIIDVRAEGALEPAMRACMMRAVDTIEVPPFDGVILARWPLYSRPELGPPTLELHPDLATAIDAIGRP